MSGSSGTPLPVTAALIGQTVTFSSSNPTDATVYKGIIEGIISYNLIGIYGFDVVSYNAAVQRVVTTVGDVSVLNYFIITLTNNQPLPTNRLFANEWIAPGSFSVIQNKVVYNLNVYDLPANGLPAILTVLQAAGYNAVPVTTPSAAASMQGSTTLSSSS